MDYENIWRNALVEIELNVSRANFVTWFRDTNIGGVDNGIVLLNVPSNFAQDWLGNKFHKCIINAIRNQHLDIRNVEYVIVPNTGAAQKMANKQIAAAQATQNNHQHEEQLGFKELYTDKEFNLNPKYSFDSFIVGSFNEVAYAAATAVTKNIGSMYNPLFIYGGVGLGKTHLLQAMGNQIKKDNPHMRVYYMTSEQFANEYIASIENKTINAFKEKHRKYNFLIIDDIQFFSGKLKIQEEFFHVFNELYDKNNQIVFSSDKPPKHIAGLEERLRSRFEGGMIVDISQPEYESRLAILKTKVAIKGFPIEQEVLEYIAANIHDNIRELEGALNSVIGQSKIKGRILTVEDIKEVLKKNIEPAKNLTVTQVIKTVADFYEIDEKGLFEKTRRKEIVKPRQIAMFLLREDLSASYPTIGAKFGQRDHTTVIHAYKKISGEMKTSDKLIQEIKSLRELLYKKSG